MQQTFYRQYILNRTGVKIVFPKLATDRALVHKIIYHEIFQQKIFENSKQDLLGVINRLKEDQGVTAVILGNSELNMLLSQDDTDVPLIDTMAPHVVKAVEFALKIEEGEDEFEFESVEEDDEIPEEAGEE